MNKADALKLWNTIKTSAAHHSPGILTGIGITGMITAVVLAVRATPKAIEQIAQLKKKMNRQKLTPMETIKTAWKCYLPTALTCVTSAGCLVASNRISGQRAAALATAYSISETALKEYREKVVETVGEKKEKNIRDEVSKEQIKDRPVSNIIVTGKGDTLCFDSISKHYFNSSVDKIKKAENEINRRLRDEMYLSLNEFYGELGLPHMDKVGDAVGWNIEKGYLDVYISTQLADDGVTPCLVMNYDVIPEYNYY